MPAHMCRTGLDGLPIYLTIANSSPASRASPGAPYAYERAPGPARGIVAGTQLEGSVRGRQQLVQALSALTPTLPQPTQRMWVHVARSASVCRNIDGRRAQEISSDKRPRPAALGAQALAHRTSFTSASSSESSPPLPSAKVTPCRGARVDVDGPDDAPAAVPPVAAAACLATANALRRFGGPWDDDVGFESAAPLFSILWESVRMEYGPPRSFMNMTFML